MKALSEWHLGEVASSHETRTAAISLAKALGDLQALALALQFAAYLAQFEGNPREVEVLASDLTELSMRQNFAFWLPGAGALHGWARSVSGDTVKGIALIEQALEDWRATGSSITTSYYLTLKSEALHRAGRVTEALEVMKQAEAQAERWEDRWWYAELLRLRGVVLAAMGADETQIEASFQEAIRIAREQRSASLAKRAEETCAEYRRQKGSASGRQQFRLPLC